MISITKERETDGTERKICLDSHCRRKGTDRHSERGERDFGIKPGDTLILLGDVKRGIAIPPKESLASYMNLVFEDDKNE